MECLSFQDGALRNLYGGIAGKIPNAPGRGVPANDQIHHEIMITDEY
jgi:hypothetical protein